MRKLTNLTKIVILLGLTLTLVMSTGLSASAAAGDVLIYNDGVLMNFPDQKPFINSDGRTMVPVRFPAEAFGAEVTWEQATKTAQIDLANKQVKLSVGSKNYTVNGVPAVMDTEAVLLNQRTLVPLRFISEGLGVDIDWKKKNDGSMLVFTFTKGQSDSEKNQIMESILTGKTVELKPNVREDYVYVPKMMSQEMLRNKAVIRARAQQISYEGNNPYDYATVIGGTDMHYTGEVLNFALDYMDYRYNYDGKNMVEWNEKMGERFATALTKPEELEGTSMKTENYANLTNVQYTDGYWKVEVVSWDVEKDKVAIVNLEVYTRGTDTTKLMVKNTGFREVE